MYFTFLFFAFFSSHAFVENSNEITVISYNIRYDNPEDGENQWKFRKETVVNFIKDSKAEVVGLQEVLQDQLKYLTNELQDFSYTGVGREDGKTKGEYSPILFNTNKLRLIKSNTFWLSETPNEISVGWDAALERICTYALFEHIQSGKYFWVFNTHFDHRGERARLESAKLILNKIEALNVMGIPVIVTGDFNLTPETIPIKIVQNTFEDVMELVPPTEKRFGTFTGFKKHQTGLDRIDYIFKKDFQLKRADHPWVKTERGSWASDHHPVQATFLFKD